MKVVGYLLFLALIISAAQAIAVALYAAIILSFIIGLVVAPKEVFGLMGLGLLIGLVQVQPLACLGLVALMVVANLLHKFFDRLS